MAPALRLASACLGTLLVSLGVLACDSAHGSKCVRASDCNAGLTCDDGRCTVVTRDADVDADLDAEDADLDAWTDAEADHDANPDASSDARPDGAADAADAADATDVTDGNPEDASDDAMDVAPVDADDD